MNYVGSGLITLGDEVTVSAKAIVAVEKHRNMLAQRDSGEFAIVKMSTGHEYRVPVLYMDAVSVWARALYDA